MRRLRRVQISALALAALVGAAEPVCAADWFRFGIRRLTDLWNPNALAKTPPPRANPIEVLAKEAKRVNLFGTTEATGKGFTGNLQRPSFEHSELVKRRMIAFVRDRIEVETKTFIGSEDTYQVRLFFVSEEKDAYLRRQIIGGVRRLGTGALRAARVDNFLTRLRVLGGFYHGDPAVHISNGNERLRDMADTAGNFAAAVAYFEGNLSPNDLGYIGDQTLSLVRKDEIVLDMLERARGSLLEQPDLFGTPEKTFGMFNRVADRLEPQRPRFRGKLTRPDVEITRLPKRPD